MERGLWVVVLCALFVGSQATNYTWQSTTGGSWLYDANWDPAGVPGPDDTAIFDYSPCYGYDADTGEADCPVDLGNAVVTVAGLMITQSGGRNALKGTLVVTKYTYLESFTFFNLNLTTQTFTQYSSDANDPSALISSTWTLQGFTLVDNLDWSVTTTQITNQGTFNVTYSAYYETLDGADTGQTDYTKSLFTNAGTMNVYTYPEYDDSSSSFEGSFVNTGTFNNVGGLYQFISSTSITYRAYTKWTGTFASVKGSTTEFYLGTHNFSSGLTLKTNGVLSFVGPYATWDSPECGAASFDITVNITSLSMDTCFTLYFNQPTYIVALDIAGGTISGSSTSIVIGNFTGGSSEQSSSSGSCPLFNSKYITVIDGHDLSGLFSIHDDAMVQINGTVSCYIHMDWLGQYVLSINDYSTGGTLQVNPQGRLVLHASDDIYVYAHYFYIPVNIYGRVDAVKAQDVDATFSETQIGNFLGGGIIAGPCSAILGYVDDQSEYDYGDLVFYGDWTIQEGAAFTGAGIFFFDGPADTTIVFDIPYTFDVVVTLGYVAEFQFNYNMTFSTLYWSGGALFSTNDVTLTLLSGNHEWYGYNYALTIDGLTILNYGNITHVGDTVASYNAILINNGNFTTSQQTFDPDGGELIIQNNGYFVFPVASNSDASNIILVNNGTIYNQIGTDTASSNDNLGFDNSYVYLLTSGTYSVNIYGAAGDYGDFDLPYDVAYFLSSPSCRLGGTLKVNFIKFPPHAGSTPFTPVVGDVYSVFAMYGATNDATVGSCLCQFDSVVTAGLDLTKFSVGVTYDTTNDVYRGTFLINVVICNAGDSSCATNTRTGTSCPPYTGITSGTTGTTGSRTTTGTTGGTPGTSGGTPGTTGTNSVTTGSNPGTTGTTPATSGVSPGDSTSTTGSSNDTSGAAAVVVSLSILFVVVCALL